MSYKGSAAEIIHTSKQVMLKCIGQNIFSSRNMPDLHTEGLKKACPVLMSLV